MYAKVWTFALMLSMFAAPIAGWTQVTAEHPLDIEAEQVNLAFKKKTATFTGNVRIQQGDFTLTADKLTVFQTRKNDVDRVVAVGNVLVVRGEEKATGKTATYTPKTETLKLEGGVTLQRGQSTMRGDTLLYSLKDGTLKMKTNKGQKVRAQVSPEDLQQ